MRFVAFGIAALTLVACSTYRDQLARSERAFEQNDNDRTLALLRDLEPDFAHLSRSEQTSYAYIRGMTDYNVGYKADARHWLSVAKAYDVQTPGSLSSDQKTKAAAALKDLNDFVYAKGAGELVNGAAAPPTPADAAAPAKGDKKAGKPKPKAPADEDPDQ